MVGIAAGVVIVVVVDDRVLVMGIVPVAIVIAGGIVGVVDVVVTAAVVPGVQDRLGHDVDIRGVDDTVAVDVGVRASRRARVMDTEQDVVQVGAVERAVAIGVDRERRVADRFIGAPGEGAEGGEEESGGQRAHHRVSLVFGHQCPLPRSPFGCDFESHEVHGRDRSVTLTVTRRCRRQPGRCGPIARCAVA